MFLLLFFVFMVLIFAIAFVIVYYVKQNYLANQKRVNELADKKLIQENFKMNRRIVIEDNITANRTEIEMKKFIGVDEENDKIALVDYKSADVVIVKFENILNYELYENNTLQTLGVGIGGMLRVMDATTVGNCRDLRLIVRIKNLEKSQVAYELVAKSFGLPKTSNEFRICMQSVQEAISFLEVIIDKNKTMGKREHS